MKNRNITIERLIDESVKMRQQVAELEAFKTDIKQSEELFKTLFHSSPIGIYIAQDGHLRLVGHQFARITGHNEDELIGIPPLNLVLSEDRNTVRENAVKMLKGERSSGYEFRIVTKRAEIKWVMETVVPIFYERRRATLGNLIDITERKQTEQELRQMTTEMKHSNTELGQFAHVVSHDLQEPLRMIASYTQLLARRYHGKLDTDADEFITYVVDGTSRMQALLSALLDYSRVGSRGKPFKSVYCEHVFDQAMANVKVTIEESGAVVSHDPLPIIMADEGQLVQLFQNLISNAAKYRSQEPPRIHVSVEAKHNERVFSVRDNGIGIDSKHAQSIFEIFRRLHTKEEYPGTGIGLAICKKIVERHGGHIWVQSQPGKGSIFYFTVPITGGESL